MSNFLSVGSIIDPSRDPNPSSGPHLDVRIIPKYGDQSGQRIDPSTRPNLLERIFIGDGEGRKPLTSFPLTSPYGPRNTGIEGASRFHKGHDYGIDVGQKIFVQGADGYFSQNGVGVATLTDANGNPYEIEFYHTDPADSTIDPTPMPGGGSGSKAVGASDSPQATAKAKAKAYKDMSKSEMNAAYDAIRNQPNAREEGLKMHKAFFNKS